jgi:hypothetical protein
MNINMLLWWSLGRGNTVVPSRWQATPWTACCPNRSPRFWNGKQSSGCGSLSSSTASTSELRYEHGRDSQPGEPRADDCRGTDAEAPSPAAWRRRTQSEAGTETTQITDIVRSVAGGTYR